MTPTRASRQRFVLVSAVATVFGLYGWAMFLSTFGHDGTIGPHNNAVGTDWMIYYAAARAVLAGDPALVYDGVRLTASVNGEFAWWLSQPMPYHAFLYPPLYLLLLLPFAGVPFLVSYAGAQILSLAALAAASWRFVGEGARRWIHLGSLLLCPAASNNVVSGQNAFLTGALLVGGLGLAERRPIAGGALLGILAYKPQCALMVPVALVARRQWRALASAAATALLLVLASVLVLGTGLWSQWIGLALSPPQDVAETWRDWGRLWDNSVYTCVALLGAPDALANAAQAAAVLLSAGLVYWSGRRAMDWELRLGVVLAATVAAAPHVSAYDMVLSALAASIVLARTLERRFRPADLVIPLAVWLAPLFSPPRLSPVGLATPILLYALILCLTTRADDAPRAFGLGDGVPS